MFNPPRASLVSFEKLDNHPYARLFRFVPKGSGVLRWPEIARLDPVQNILFIDKEIYDQSDDFTRHHIKRCQGVMVAE